AGEVDVLAAERLVRRLKRVYHARAAEDLGLEPRARAAELGQLVEQAMDRDVAEARRGDAVLDAVRQQEVIEAAGTGRRVPHADRDAGAEDGGDGAGRGR